MPFTPPDPTEPPDSDAISNGAGWIRSLKSYLVDMLSVSLDLTTGEIRPEAVPNGLPTPYGAAGTILQSTGSGTAPAWAVVGTVVPAGAVFMFAGALPSGYLECDGSTKAIATYTALAAVLGTTFGGDGVTTFGLPDLRGRTPVGLGTGDADHPTAWTLGRKDGDEIHVLTEDQIPAHTHSLPHGSNGIQADGNAGNAGGIISGRSPDESGSTGGGLEHNNLQPSLGLRMVIKT